MRKLKFLPAVAVLLLSLPAFSAEEYKIDPVHSSATFSVKHLLVSTVRGRFAQMSGTIVLDEADMTKSSVNAGINAASINTDNERRDNDLRGPNFFEVAKYPEITFKSTRVEKTADGYVAIGMLTMKDVSKEIRLPFSLEKGEARGTSVLGIEATTKLNRFDYNVNYDKTGTTVGKEVKVEITIEAKKAPSAAAGAGSAPKS